MKFSAAEIALLGPEEIALRLAALPHWTLDGQTISREFVFTDYYEATAFLNATAWISHRLDHHPDISLGYKQCRLSYSSHDVNGLSGRDFLCAARVDALLEI